MIATAHVNLGIEQSPSPHSHECLDTLLDVSNRHNVAVGTLGVIFQPRIDDERGLEVVHQASALSIPVVNCQIKAPLECDEAASLARIGELYLNMLEEAGGRTLPCLEPHVDMWLEQFDRVQKLADWLGARGAPLHLTIDHSHLLYRIDNAAELLGAGLDSVEEGRRLLSPFSDESYCNAWLSQGLIAHAHARCVQINAPSNLLQARTSKGLPGRGIQYPISKPSDGSEWDKKRCETWKAAVRQMIKWRAQNSDSPLHRVSCEFIPYPDYGGGARYSIFEQNVACADWLRVTMAQTLAETQVT